MKKLSPEIFEGVWSATPTPFNADFSIDRVAVRALLRHHLRLGIKGLFLAGTCGEGAWMTEAARADLVRTAVDAAKGQLGIAVQVSDNSADRILENIRAAKAGGADLAVIAPPGFLMNATDANIEALYIKAIRNSPLPVCLYDLGKLRNLFVPPAVLKKIYAEPNVVAAKDSSSDPVRMKIALAARKARPNLRLLTGDEFHCAEYIAGGYDGLMLGGAAFQGHLAGLILAAARAGNTDAANKLQARMSKLMLGVYGGKKIACWLAGEKKLLMELGVFRTLHNYPNFTLNAACEREIARIVVRDRDILLP